MFWDGGATRKDAEAKADEAIQNGDEDGDGVIGENGNIFNICHCNKKFNLFFTIDRKC